MKYDDLEKTKDLFDIVDVPSPIENIEMEGANKGSVSEEEDLLGLMDDTPEEKTPEKDDKNKKPEKKGLSKKKKIAIIVAVVVVLVIAITVVVYFLLKDKENVEEPAKPEEPTVIVEKDNYIYKDGVLSLLDENDKELGTYECKNKDEKLCFVVDYNDEDTFDVGKNYYEDGTLIPRKSAIYQDKYVFIYDNEKAEDGMINLYNIEEAKNEDSYLLVKGFANSNYVILQDTNKKYGAIEFNLSGITKKIDFKFDYLGRMNEESKIVAKTNNKYFIYNLDGKIESKGLTQEIKSYNNNYIVAYDDGYYVYDYKSKLVMEDSFDYASLLDKYVALVQDNKLYIRDYENNKYNEDGIEISGDDYNVRYVYNADKVLQKTDKVFEIAIDGNIINVTYVRRNIEKTQTIDINEGVLSAKLANISYFDNKLYFYSDEDKMNLIGSYECGNKNNVGNKTTTLSNCGIAKESFYSKNETEEDKSDKLGFIPIYNERYVFVNDTIDSGTQSIVLYDLKNHKTLSRYLSVDAGAYTGEEKVSFKITEGAYIMAQSKNSNNKYGLIKINDDSVESVIKFDYDSIEKLKEYYMVKESEGTCLLLDKAGEEQSGHLGYKITNYLGAYFKVLNPSDNKYGVIDSEGNKVSEVNYLDITLKDSYFVAINTNRALEIYKYNNSDFKLNTPIPLSEDYKNDYEVSSIGDGFVVKVKSTGNTINIDSEGYQPGEKPVISIPEDPNGPDDPENPDEPSNDPEGGDGDITPEE